MTRVEGDQALLFPSAFYRRGKYAQTIRQGVHYDESKKAWIIPYETQELTPNGYVTKTSELEIETHYRCMGFGTRYVWRDGKEYCFTYDPSYSVGEAVYWLFEEQWGEGACLKYIRRLDEEDERVFELACYSGNNAWYRQVSVKDVILNGTNHYHCLLNFDKIWLKYAPGNGKFKKEKKETPLGMPLPDVPITREFLRNYAEYLSLCRYRHDSNRYPNLLTYKTK